MRLQFGTGSRDGLEDLAQDEFAGFFCLRQRLRHDFGGDARDFDVHLQGSDAFAGAGYFKVHITEVIFSALDIGQDSVVFAFFYQAHGYTSYGCLNWHTGIH